MLFRSVMSERGQWFARPDGLRVLVTLHPAALLRMQQDQQAASYAGWLADLALAGAIAIPTAASDAF